MANTKISVMNSGAPAQGIDQFRIARFNGIDYDDYKIDLDDVITYIVSDGTFIESSEKGVANGVATLDAGGKVPASQLTLVSTAFKGNWDATANSPVLSDLTGVGGDFYFIQNGTSRNLGSGAINWTTGALIIHNGSIWVENEAVNNVISVAGKTGAVVLNTADVSPSTDRRYILDDWEAALTNATPMDALNPVATMSDIPAGAGNTYNITISGGLNLVTGYGDGINDVGGSESSRTLSSLGYNNTTAATQWPLTAAAWGGITAASTEYDEVCLQEALLTMRDSKLRYLGAGTSILLIRRGNIELPGWSTGFNSEFFDPLLFVIDGMGCTLKGIAAHTYMLTSNITSQSQAESGSQAPIKYRTLFQNWRLHGHQGVGTALRMGAMKAPVVRNCHFSEWEVGIRQSFCLNSKIEDCRILDCTTYGIYVDSGSNGWWSGAACDTAGNQPRVDNCYITVTGGSAIGVYFRATDGGIVRDSVIEGAGGLCAIFYDNAGCGVSKVFSTSNIHIELQGNTAAFTDSIVKLKGAGFYDASVSDFYIQLPQSGSGANVPIVNIQCDSTGILGRNYVKVSNMKYSGSNDQYKLKRTGTGQLMLELDNVRLQGNPTQESHFFDPINYPNIWAAGSNHTDASINNNGNTRIRINPLLVFS